MTLILTIANTSGVYQSSDYQLTDHATGVPFSDRAGSKQIQTHFKGLDVNLAFTGIALVFQGLTHISTVDWLTMELKAFPGDTTLPVLCEAIANRCTKVLTSLGLRGILELILTVSVIGEPFRVIEISNVSWDLNPPKAKSKFNIRIHRIKNPFYLISGMRSCMTTILKDRLRALSRDTTKQPGEVLDKLADINAIASKNSKGYISEGCWVTYQGAEGGTIRSVSKNIGNHPGIIVQLLGGHDISDLVQKNYRAAPGKQMGIVQIASKTIKGGGIRLPPPKGESRIITFSGFSSSVKLFNKKMEQCASIEISHLDCNLNLRCNEEAIITFAKVSVTGIFPIHSDFSCPLLPWPQLCIPLKLNDATVPRGWEYSIGYWIENSLHNVEILQGSRSIRKISFLAQDDEVIIVLPRGGVKLTWGESDGSQSAFLKAKIIWRSRLDGTFD